MRLKNATRACDSDATEFRDPACVGRHQLLQASFALLSLERPRGVHEPRDDAISNGVPNGFVQGTGSAHLDELQRDAYDDQNGSDADQRRDRYACVPHWSDRDVDNRVAGRDGKSQAGNHDKHRCLGQAADERQRRNRDQRCTMTSCRRKDQTRRRTSGRGLSPRDRRPRPRRRPSARLIGP